MTRVVRAECLHIESCTRTYWRIRESASGHKEDVRVGFAPHHLRVVTAEHLVVKLAEELLVTGHLELAVDLPAGGCDGHWDVVVCQVLHQPPDPGLEPDGGQEWSDLTVHLLQELQGGESQAALLHDQPGGVPRLLACSPGLQGGREEVRTSVPLHHLQHSV